MPERLNNKITNTYKGLDYRGTKVAGAGAVANPDSFTRKFT
jgi:hypothetical protein